VLLSIKSSSSLTLSSRTPARSQSSSLGTSATSSRASTGDGPQFLLERGFFEPPFICPRWETTGNDAYGRSVAMDALGDIKQLQQETKRKGQAIDKLANPPMVADVELKNKPASTIPGGVTFITKPNGAGFKPAYENFRPPVQELMSDIQQIQQRIKDTFFNDLFLMISNLDTVRTATEIDARREEKLVMLGPVLERLQTEGQDPIIDRVFGIMSRGGLFEDPPPEIANAPIQIEYVSMLAEAQRAANTTGMERFLAQIGNVAAVKPDVLDIPNWDRMLTRYGMVLGNDPADINSADELAVIRQQRAKQQQQPTLWPPCPSPLTRRRTFPRPMLAADRTHCSKSSMGRGVCNEWSPNHGADFCHILCIVLSYRHAPCTNSI
jgi:hypothetical protein